jgi:hypothetical protein
MEAVACFFHDRMIRGCRRTTLDGVYRIETAVAKGLCEERDDDTHRAHVPPRHDCGT